MAKNDSKKKKTNGIFSESSWTPAQEELADILGISQQAVSKLYGKGVFTKGANGWKQIAAYSKHLREQAAGRAGDDNEFDLVTERARLAARQAEEKELELDERRGNLLPKKVIASVLGFQHGTIRARLLSLPNRLKAQYPNLSTDVYLAAKALVHEALTELAHVRFPTGIDRRTRKYFLDLHSATQRKRNGVGG